jgi:hypothetical protein
MAPHGVSGEATEPLERADRGVHANGDDAGCGAWHVSDEWKREGKTNKSTKIVADLRLNAISDIVVVERDG